MTTPRKDLVDATTPGFYHCTNRCVRRAFLCGFDNLSGNDYQHRKAFLENYMRELCQYFSIEIYAHAIMDNHYHIVLYLDPHAPRKWSDATIAERWLQATGGSINLPQNAEKKAQRIRSILNNHELLDCYRERLGSLSWFMKQLNETVARRCNLEDDCTGRFWEGRFTSKALLDEASLISCMAYVDLNPVRAKIVEKLEESNHTSIKYRLQKLKKANLTNQLDETLPPIAGNLNSRPINFSLKTYIDLVEWAGRAIHQPNRGYIPAHLGAALDRLNLQSSHWLIQIQHFEKGFGYFIGPVKLIREKAIQLQKKWLRGIKTARLFYCRNSEYRST